MKDIELLVVTEAVEPLARLIFYSKQPFLIKFPHKICESGVRCSAKNIADFS